MSSDAPQVPRTARWFVGVLFATLLVPGLIGFDAWPLTGWRLFSADRGNTQNRWEIASVDADGALVPIDLDDLPIAYRNAEWILAELPGADEARSEAVCQALLGGVQEHLEIDVEELALVRNRRTMEAVDGGFAPTDDRETIHTCGSRA